MRIISFPRFWGEPGWHPMRIISFLWVLGRTGLASHENHKFPLGFGENLAASYQSYENQVSSGFWGEPGWHPMRIISFLSVLRRTGLASYENHKFPPGFEENRVGIL